MTCNLFIFIILIIIIILIINIMNNYKKIDNFDAKYNYNNDGNMKFDYLSDPGYTEKILYNYYVNDDAKINGNKVNYHPYQSSRQNCRVEWGARPYVYGNIWCQRKPGRWNKLDNYGQEIYDLYGVRR